MPGNQWLVRLHHLDPQASQDKDADHFVTYSMQIKNDDQRYDYFHDYDEENVLSTANNASAYMKTLFNRIPRAVNIYSSILRKGGAYAKDTCTMQLD